jgi:CitMHS family citrate-Mg2+:H+ or citrate-Ca2+:H+ symporter
MQAMGNSIINVVQAGVVILILLPLYSVCPLTFLTNDAYYFGILPVILLLDIIVSPRRLDAQNLVGQASPFMSPLVPSTYLLVSLLSVNFQII